MPDNNNEFNLSLVAWYGEKPAPVAALIEDAQAVLADCLPATFVPYAPEQVHGTLVSLEGWHEQDDLINKNYADLRGERRVMDLPGALRLAAQIDAVPFDVLIGGYQQHHDYSFDSRGRTPWRRSFSVQGQIAVAMGWPHRDGRFPVTLQQLRAAFRQANVLHKYHRDDSDYDNDFFFVLGTIDPDNSTRAEVEETERRMRAFFAEREPLNVSIDRSQLSVIAYRDAKVPPDSTLRFSLDEAVNNPDKLLALYPRR